jgi:glycosyltransferase involved in cell wall biosynthesis
MAMKQAVISLLNTPAGRFAWYEEFPRRITTRLAAHGIDHIVGYKSYFDHSTIPLGERLVMHDETDAPFAARVSAILGPLMARYDQVILHTHAYSSSESRFWPVVRRHPNAQWWTTVHATPRPRARWRRTMRGVCQTLRWRYPQRVYGCSQTATTAAQRNYPSHRVGALVNGRLTAEDLNRFQDRQSPRRALLVARLIPAKGIEVALEAAALILAEVPDFRLVILGNGRLREPGTAWVTERDLGHAIRFVGYHADVQPWYREADLLWIPTIPHLHREGLPLVAMEAQGHGIPSIYSLSGGLPESQVEGVTGLALDPVDPTTLAQRTLELIHDEPRYHEMRRGIVAQRDRWSIDRMVNDYVTEYLKELRPSALPIS